MDAPSSRRVSVSGATHLTLARLAFVYGTFTRYGGAFQTPSTDRFDESGLLRVRSPLLTEFSLFLRVLRCFSSPGARVPAYAFSRSRPNMPSGGFPHSEIVGSSRLHTPDRPFSQCPTSFFGSTSPGIHRMPFVACVSCGGLRSYEDPATSCVCLLSLHLVTCVR